MAEPFRDTLHWRNGLGFRARVGERGFEMDGNRRAGCSPMELLALSLAGCTAIDVVHILGKMRSAVTALRAEVEGARALALAGEVLLRVSLAPQRYRIRDLVRDRVIGLPRIARIFAVL